MARSSRPQTLKVRFNGDELSCYYSLPLSLASELEEGPSIGLCQAKKQAMLSFLPPHSLCHSDTFLSNACQDPLAIKRHGGS